MNDKIKPGARFRHARCLSTWTPVRDRVPALCQVTRVTKTTVYYRHVGRDGQLGMRMFAVRDRFPEIVKEWVD